jgi:hypothetical protein
MSGERQNSPLMPTATSAEARLKTTLTATYDVAALSDMQWQRIEAQAELKVARNKRLTHFRRRARAVFALVGATAAAALFIALQPKLATARVLERMEAAIRDVRAARLVLYRVQPDGSRIRTTEIWIQNGQTRSEERDGTVTLYTQGRLWQYDPQLQRVIVRKAAGAYAYNRSGFTVAAMVRDMTGWGWQKKLRDAGEAVVNNRRVHLVMIEDARGPERTILYVDPETDLPLRSEVQIKQETWKTLMEAEHHYNPSMAAGLFRTEFPKSVRVLDYDQGRKDWAERLKKKIAQRRVGDRTIAIRDVQVTAEGDIFLLYTAGKFVRDSRWTGNKLAGRDWEIDLADDLGTHYLRQSGVIYPTIERQTAKLPNGYVFNRERLECDWWTPLVPQSPWKPRKLSFTFRVSPVNIHGSTKDPEVEAKYTERVRFDTRMARPTTALLPDWMLYMAVGLSKEYGLRSLQLSARAHHYRYAERNLEQAVAQYREAIRVTEAYMQQRGETGGQSGTWFALYETLRELGRHDEALAALRQARDQKIYRGTDYEWKQIEAALKKESIE